MSNWLSIVQQKQLWLYSTKEEKALTEAIGHHIYNLEKKVFLSKKEVEEVNTLTNILKRLGYGINMQHTPQGEWTKCSSKTELFYRVETKEQQP
jgi:hypothetical protein